MKIRNPDLYKKLIALNVILPNGRINTRWKKMVVFKELSIRAKDRLELFSLIWDYPHPKCRSCGAYPSFKNPNFLTGDGAFSTVCSKKCQYELVAKTMAHRDPKKEKQRIEKFRKTILQKTDGVSKASRIAKKAAQTKTKTFINGVSVLELQKQKTYKTKVQNGTQVPHEKLAPFDLYRRKVHALSKKEPIYLLANHEKRGHYNNGGYHLDHVLSVFDGFRLGIPAEVVASIVNLRFISAAENSSKSSHSHQLLQDLISRYFDYKILGVSFSDIGEFNLQR